MEARLLRDAHLGSIWEGTSNIVALDVMRSIRRNATLEPLYQHVQTLLSEFGGELIPGSVKPVLGSSKPGGSSASATWYDTVSSPVIHTKRTHS